MKDKVVHFVRAYNDLDCRIPLLLEFHKDPRYKSVKVIGIPTNRGIHDPNNHELASFLIGKGIEITTIYELSRYQQSLKLFYAVQHFFDHRPNIPFINKVLRKARYVSFKGIFFGSRRNKAWVRGVLKALDSTIVIVDEIAFQKGRSFFIDELITNRNFYNYSLYCFITGQDTYLDQWRDTESYRESRLECIPDIPLFVPGENDKTLLGRRLPAKTIDVVGNSRFDAEWMHTLSGIMATKIKEDPRLSRPCAKKIVFMLSKVEYGVDLQNIVETINRCAQIENAIVIVKPHTRGMKLADLGSPLDDQILDGAIFSSSELTEWADSILFTGSSIIFQAMLLEKQAIFLKYCQRYGTIFDESSAVLIADHVNDVVDFITCSHKYLIDWVESCRFLREHVHNGISSGLVCEYIKRKIELEEKKERGHG